jgi:hypothetical protein
MRLIHRFCGFREIPLGGGIKYRLRRDQNTAWRRDPIPLGGGIKYRLLLYQIPVMMVLWVDKALRRLQ